MNAVRGSMRLFVIACVAAIFVATAHAAPPQSVAGFNDALSTATKAMDNAAMLALWDEDGISLLPSTAPIVGRDAIGRFLDSITASLAGSRMETFDLDCHDIRESGSWASEWCTEHQKVRLPAGKPPFEGWGKMLLVLHRGDDGRWRVHEEMWNQAEPPAQAANKP